MKRITLIFTLLVAFTLSYAQETTTTESSVAPQSNLKEDVNFVSPKSTIEKYHNEVELEKMGKIELTNLYLERVKVVTEIIPYIALNRRPAGAQLKELGIPQTKNNVSLLEKEVSNEEKYMETLLETLQDIIPYADKGNIIWSILFMESIIHDIEKSEAY